MWVAKNEKTGLFFINGKGFIGEGVADVLSLDQADALPLIWQGVVVLSATEAFPGFSDRQIETAAEISEGAGETLIATLDEEEREELACDAATMKVVLDGGRGCGCVALVYPDGSYEWLC